MPSIDTSSLPVMPPEIPCPFVSNYGIQSINPIQATAMVSGRARTRNRWPSVPQQVSLTYRLDDNEAQIFEGFMRFEASNGAKPFIQHLCMPGDLEPKRYVVHLTEIYDGASFVDGSLDLWDFTMMATTLFDERPTEAEYASLTLLGGETIDEAMADMADLNPHWLPEYQDSYYKMPASGRAVAGIGNDAT
ncbi:hypothetical protein R84981_000986 [Carnimonas sp. R-84981]|uniref:hypothetical protein n=1 Tax=Carnimonas bestiolae TaxID=3402172 RepID=UPI003EDB8BE4